MRRILRPAVTAARAGVSNMTLWRWEKAGLFPKRVKLGPNSAGHFEDEVDAWLAAKAAARPYTGQPAPEAS